MDRDRWTHPFLGKHFYPSMVRGGARKGREKQFGLSELSVKDGMTDTQTIQLPGPYFLLYLPNIVIMFLHRVVLLKLFLSTLYITACLCISPLLLVLRFLPFFPIKGLFWEFVWGYRVLRAAKVVKEKWWFGIFGKYEYNLQLAYLALQIVEVRFSLIVLHFNSKYHINLSWSTPTSMITELWTWAHIQVLGFLLHTCSCKL